MKKMKKVTAAVSAAALAISLYTVYPAVTHAAIPSSPANSTIFGPHVYVFDPSMSRADIESVTSAVYGEQEKMNSATNGMRCSSSRVPTTSI